jgi:hypothetical protein
MSYGVLKSALQAVPATGEHGFEGLIAELLARLVQERFVIARAGDQSGGDAQNTRGSVALQAKRYRDNTSLSWREIEADIRESLRSLPHLETFVVAVTRSTTQLQARLNVIQEETGLDIVALDYSGDRSRLGVLCVSYWNTISHFPGMEKLHVDRTFCEWIRNESAQQEVTATLVSLKREILESIVTYRAVSSRALRLLRKRFGEEPPDDYSRMDVIDISEAVPRTQIEGDISDWWTLHQNLAAYVEGEEGFGKSWAAARSARNIASTSDTLVWWLGSLEWCESRNLSEVVDRALGATGFVNDVTRKRLIHKAIRVWNSPILIVLDGANERDALNSLKRVLADLFQKDLGHLRILVTTRALEQRTQFDRSLWRGCRRIFATIFTDEEYEIALGKAGLTVAAIPESLSTIARIPRYFQTCVRLRDRLGEGENITKEIVFWVELCDKIDSTDPQVRNALRWTTPEDAAAVLARLATRAASDENRTVASSDLLNVCFNGEYDHIRRDLEELRISAKAEKFQAELTREHVILGWALYLHEIVTATQTTTVRDIADIVWRMLEPMPAEDLRTEAIFVALQLSVLRPGIFAEMSTLKRAGLLYAWLLSRNAAVYENRLEFWTSEDLSAYAEFIDAFFEELFSANHQQLVIRPLAQKWAQNQGEQLRLHLKRWLLLVWSNHDLPAGPGLVYKGHSLPIARNDQQLRLSAIAVSVLSLRPDTEMLETLALSRATLFLSTHMRDRDTTERPWPLKSIEKNIGVLLRWGYTEQVLPHLEIIANTHKNDEVILEGIRLMAKSLSVAALPTILQMPPTNEPQIHWISAIQLIRERRSVFSGANGNIHASYQEIPYLAARTDLPDLSDGDYDKIQQLVEEICSNPDPLGERVLTQEELLLRNYLPWYARRTPAGLAILVGRLRLAALRRGDPYIALTRFAGAYHAPEMSQEITSKSYERVSSLTGDRAHAVAEITELIVCQEDTTKILAWLAFLAVKPDIRKYLFYYPIPWLLRIRLGQDTAKVAIERAGRVGHSTRDNGYSEFEFWCYVAASCSGVDDDIYNWAKKQIELPDLDLGQHFWVFALLAASGRPSVLERDLGSLKFASKLHANSMRAYWAFRKNAPDRFSVTSSYEDLMASMPQDFVGYLLRVGERQDEFKRWGRELLELACELVQQPPFTASHRGGSFFQLDEERRVEVRGYLAPPQRTSFGSAMASSWGVNYGSESEFSRRMSGDFTVEHADMAAWKSDDERFQTWNHYDIAHFSALPELRHWARQNQTDFRQLSARFIQNADRACNPLFHLGMLSHGIIQILVEFDPVGAFKAYSDFQSSSIRVHVQTPHKTSSVLAEYWKGCYNDSVEHQKVREQIVNGIKTDAEALSVVLDALTYGSCGWLRHMAEATLKVPVARRRSLAISLLAWFGDERAIQSLGQMAETDSSIWVRDHARWAFEVASQEKGARELYRAALAMSAPTEVSAALQQIKPALTPMARWWHRVVEAENIGQTAPAPVINALRTSFWNDWEATQSTHIKVFGRNVDEYFCGETLDSFVTPFIAPWWSV